MKRYKIKVGIEEFKVDEKDISRITEAMKTDNLVALDCGVFRGSAILALCEDTSVIDFGSLPPSEEEIKQKAIDDFKREQRLNCELCDHTGWKEELRGQELIRVLCDCQKLKISDTLNEK